MSPDFTYSLIAINDSRNSGAICVYQKADLNVPGSRSLAWLTKRVNPTTKVVFKWNVEYAFAWYETGKLGPGILCLATQLWSAELLTTNQVSFTRNPSGFTFSGQTKGPKPCNLYVVQDGTIPANFVSVGIGMSKQGTFVTQAQPNTTTNFQAPNVFQTWITFGDYTQGEVLDLEGMTTPTVQVAYPANIYSMTATLSEQNQWSVQTTTSANLRLLEARRRR